MNTKRATKRSLLTSVMALVMCVVMLVGTTFAWFTDTASTAVNKIQAGNLDVALEMDTSTTDTPNWVSAEGKTLEFKKAAGATGEKVLWEPGCTYELPQLRVVNNGNLALKYKVIISGIQGDAKLNNAIEWTINNAGKDAVYNLGAKATSEALTIKGHMKDDAGNEYQNLSIDGISVTVIATQDTVENDSNGNTYDAGATYPTVNVTTIADAQKAIAEGSKVLLLNTNLNVTADSLGDQEQASDGTKVAALFFNKEQDAAMADTITLDGTATISTWRKAIWASHGANIVINGGTYTSVVEGKKQFLKSDLIYANNDAVITINGGTFSSNKDGELFNVSNQKGDGEGGTIIIQGGLYNKPLKANEGNVVNAWQAEDAYGEHDGKTYGIKIADDYKVVEETIDGATWYRVVKK